MPKVKTVGVGAFLWHSYKYFIHVYLNAISSFSPWCFILQHLFVFVVGVSFHNFRLNQLFMRLVHSLPPALRQIPLVHLIRMMTPLTLRQHVLPSPTREPMTPSAVSQVLWQVIPTTSDLRSSKHDSLICGSRWKSLVWNMQDTWHETTTSLSTDPRHATSRAVNLVFIYLYEYLWCWFYVLSWMVAIPVLHFFTGQLCQMKADCL